MTKCIFFILLIPLCIITRVQGFRVEDCEVDIRLNQAGYFDVEEHYRVNFTQQKHGIYRTIFTKYELADNSGLLKDYRIRIDDIDVPDRHFTSTSSWRAGLEGQMEIKIGSKDRVVSGEQEYIIRYRVYDAVIYDGGRAVFYWNIKSSDWAAVFKQVRFSVHLPGAPVLQPADYAVYAGPDGTTQKDTTMVLDYRQGTLSGVSGSVSPGSVPYAYRGTSLSLMIQLPEGTVHPPASSTMARFWRRYGWVLLMPCILTGFLIVYFKYGRDRKLPVVVNYFPPPAMDAAMAGFLINDQEDNSDLLALLPAWGNQGILSMEEIPASGILGKPDLLLRKLKALPDDTPGYAAILFNGLFPVGITTVACSSLKNQFYLTMGKAKRALQKEVMQYYDSRSEKAGKIMSITLLILAILGAITGQMIWSSALAAVCLSGFCLILLFVNRIMRRRNQLGDNLHQELAGFALFIKTAERHKLEMLLLQDPTYFEKTTAYAYAFGLLDAWGKRFEALTVKVPDWYRQTNTSFHSASLFTASFATALQGASSHLVSAPSSSSGGGSSGGGFGGGGGGSW